MALSRTFLMIRAPFFGVKARMLSALPIGWPRTRSATSRPFWAERRTPYSFAATSMSVSLLLRRRRRCGRSGDLLVGRVALEGARERELAQLVADHVLGHIHRDVLLADLTQVVLLVADFAHRRLAIHMHAADLARAHAKLRVVAFAREQLHTRTRGARDLRTLARQHLDAVHRGAHGDVAQRQRVARL